MKIKQVRLNGAHHKKIIAWLRIMKREQPNSVSKCISHTIEMYNKRNYLVELARISSDDIAKIKDNENELLVIAKSEDGYFSEWLSKTKTNHSNEIRRILNLAIAIEVEEEKKSSLLPWHMLEDIYYNEICLEGSRGEVYKVRTSEKIGLKPTQTDLNDTFPTSIQKKANTDKIEPLARIAEEEKKVDKISLAAHAHMLK